MSRRARPRRGERGAAVLEMALVFPVVLLLVLGIVQYGFHYWALSTAAATAREAARQLVVGTDHGCVREEAVAKLAATHVGAGDPTVRIAYGLPASETAPPVRGELVTVTVRLQSLDLGLAPVPDDGVVVETATNRVENVPVDALGC